MIYLFWGEDDFAINQAIAQIIKENLDPTWSSFNYDKITSDRPDSLINALTQARTPPFGSTVRIVWLAQTNITNQSAPEILEQLNQALPLIPSSSILIFTTSNKPDSRLKTTKLLQQYAQIREFSLIPPWKTEELIKRVKEILSSKGLKLEPEAIELLAVSASNNTRQLYNEIEKLQLYALTHGSQSLTKEVISSLVPSTTQSSLELANLIRQGKTSKALSVITDLINNNEPALKIIATLTGQFRTWLWIKVMIDSGESDPKVIAQKCEIGNPNRIYFLKQDVSAISLIKLSQTLPLLLDLELSLKRGADPLSTFQSGVIQLTQLCQKK